MKAITFVTQKGGSGKSTLCISLAVAAQESGRSVCILEMDRQATVSDWAERRGRLRGVVGHCEHKPAGAIDGFTYFILTADQEKALKHSRSRLLDAVAAVGAAFERRGVPDGPA